MADFDLRFVEAGHFAALLSLWHSVFGDPEELIWDFLRLLPDMGFGLAAFQGEKLAGVAYMVEGMHFVGEEELPCAFLYAVAVSPAFRRQGIGAALSRGCVELARKRGAQLVLTEPVETSLFSWYDQCIGTRGRLCRKRTAIPAHAGPSPEVLSAEEYGAERERLLGGKPHMRPSPPVLQFEKALCRAYGGDLYRLGGSIAAAYREKGSCIVRELLGGEQQEEKAAALAAFLEEKQALLFAPDAGGTAYLAYEGSCLPGDCHWGISFD